MIIKQDPFQARTNGYNVFRIPGILVSKNNVVLITSEARLTHGGDWDNINIVMRRSFDGAKTFGAMKLLIDHKIYGKGPINNFVMISDKITGRIIALYCHNYSRVFKIHSDDDGETFSKPTERRIKSGVTPVDF